MGPDELLAAMAESLRREIGPAVGEPFAKTQAFMGAVILEKLAAQLRLADAHARADHQDRVALADDLEQLTETHGPARLRTAIAAVRDGGQAAVCDLIALLYAQRDELGAERFGVLLARIRQTLRARLDRQLEFAS